jgi:hypothetical protein
MHISEVEKHRMEKEHKMRHGYQDHSNKRFPHHDEDAEHQFSMKDMENKHAREAQPIDYENMMESGQ